MMSDQMMAALDAATSTEAARLYEACDDQLKDGQYEPALKRAQDIKKAQAAEIITMQSLLKTL